MTSLKDTLRTSLYTFSIAHPIICTLRPPVSLPYLYCTTYAIATFGARFRIAFVFAFRIALSSIGQSSCIYSTYSKLFATFYIQYHLISLCFQSPAQLAWRRAPRSLFPFRDCDFPRPLLSTPTTHCQTGSSGRFLTSSISRLNKPFSQDQAVLRRLLMCQGLTYNRKQLCLMFTVLQLIVHTPDTVSYSLNCDFYHSKLPCRPLPSLHWTLSLPGYQQNWSTWSLFLQQLNANHCLLFSKCVIECMDGLCCNFFCPACFPRIILGRSTFSINTSS